MSDQPVQRGPSYNWEDEARSLAKELESTRELLYKTASSSDRNIYKLEVENKKFKDELTRLQSGTQNPISSDRTTDHCIEYVNKLREENKALKEKLERTKDHFRKARVENDQIEQTVFDSIYEQNEKFREALEKIVKPANCTIYGIGSADEYEQLFVFWNMKAAERLRIAQEALED